MVRRVLAVLAITVSIAGVAATGLYVGRNTQDSPPAAPIEPTAEPTVAVVVERILRPTGNYFAGFEAYVACVRFVVMGRDAETCSGSQPGRAAAAETPCYKAARIGELLPETCR